MRAFLAVLFLSTFLLSCRDRGEAPPSALSAKPAPTTAPAAKAETGPKWSPELVATAIRQCRDQAAGFDPKRVEKYCDNVFKQASERWTLEECQRVDCLAVLANENKLRESWNKTAR